MPFAHKRGDINLGSCIHCLPALYLSIHEACVHRMRQNSSSYKYGVTISITFWLHTGSIILRAAIATCLAFVRLVDIGECAAVHAKWAKASDYWTGASFFHERYDRLHHRKTHTTTSSLERREKLTIVFIVSYKRSDPDEVPQSTDGAPACLWPGRGGDEPHLRVGGTLRIHESALVEFACCVLFCTLLTVNLTKHATLGRVFICFGRELRVSDLNFGKTAADLAQKDSELLLGGKFRTTEVLIDKDNIFAT
ncbi:hypothetical protein BDY19DRAFT_1049264 [Irpex rosettiformis]|uniref:Uncharacterized protein n=1 Tax=Irpex rosettiformis TaxID=378272 RepID=A0ACB8U040_9APHY|nr:hypothetical protein BDY19DRAFT_1049264 [Irpex rosettiformis]